LRGAALPRGYTIHGAAYEGQGGRFLHADGGIAVRPFWRGHISFGLVTFPVKLYTATEEKDVRFRLLHSECLTPIKNQRYCPYHDRVIEWKDVVRGYEISKGKFVTVSDEELESIPIDTSHSVNVAGFVELREIDPLYYERSYYVVPDEGGAKAFTLLRDVLQEENRVAVGQVVIRDKEYPVALRPYDAAMVMATLYYADEVRALSGLDELPVETKVHPNERKMAVQLVQNLSMEFRIDEFHDEYREKLISMIKAKAEGETIEAPKAATPGKVIDLMEALKRSVEMAQGQRKTASGRAGQERKVAAGGMHERAR
jgi:DNA end-binding protein Ku